MEVCRRRDVDNIDVRIFAKVVGVCVQMHGKVPAEPFQRFAINLSSGSDRQPRMPDDRWDERTAGPAQSHEADVQLVGMLGRSRHSYSLGFVRLKTAIAARSFTFW